MAWRCEAAKTRAEMQALALLPHVISCVLDSLEYLYKYIYIYLWSVCVHICWLFFLILYPFSIHIGFPDGSVVKNWPARQETQGSWV